MIRIGILGHFADGKSLNDGQTIKTKEMYDELIRNSSLMVSKADTYYMRQSATVFIKSLFSLFIHNDKIIVCLSWNGYSKILPVLVLLNIFFRRQIYDVVIGGRRHNLICHSKFYRILCSHLKKIYVESRLMQEAYIMCGLTQTSHLTNFKTLEKQPITRNFHVPLPICTFSRVMEEKGIEDAIEAVKYVNNKFKKTIFTLTIYGQIEKSYTIKFDELMNSFPTYIRYGDIVEYDKADSILSKYFLLLFPTHFYIEGVPGTLIDAAFAGVPAIVTDWNCSKEVIETGYNGKIISMGNNRELIEALLDAYENKEKYIIMREMCQSYAEKYKTHNVLHTLIEDLKK